MIRAATTTTIAIALSAALVAELSAQAPSFTGRWTSDPAAAAAPAGQAAPARGTAPAGAPGGGRGDMGSGWGSPITIVQDPKQLTVEYAFFARGDMQPPLRFVYALDGSASTNTVMMGRGIQTQTSKAAWSGDRLTITTTHTFADPATGKPTPFEVKQTLWLESPTSLVVETTRAGVMGGAATTTRTVYRKL